MLIVLLPASATQNFKPSRCKFLHKTKNFNSSEIFFVLLDDRLKLLLLSLAKLPCGKDCDACIGNRERWTHCKLQFVHGSLFGSCAFKLLCIRKGTAKVQRTFNVTKCLKLFFFLIHAKLCNRNVGCEVRLLFDWWLVWG